MSDFFDAFFYWVFVAATCLTAVDWWIGQDGRGRIRERVAHWWIYLDDLSFTGLVADDARRLRAGISKAFGPWRGARAITICLGLSVALSLMIWVISITASTRIASQMEIEEGVRILNLPVLVARAVWGDRLDAADVEFEFDEALTAELANVEAEQARHDLELMRREVAVSLNQMSIQLREEAPIILNRFILPLLLLNGLFDWLSLGVTLKLLDMMARSSSWPRLLLIVFADLTIAVIFSMLVGVFVLAFYAGPQTLLQEAASGFADSTEVVYSLRRVFEVAGVSPLAFAMPLAVLFTGVLPTLLHAIIALIFIGSKLLLPWLKPLVTRILFLFHESSKGVLTQIAVGGGVFLKVAQETVKFFSS